MNEDHPYGNHLPGTWTDSARVGRTESMTAPTLRELLIRADSYLSLLWYRPEQARSADITMEVERTIGQLRTWIQAMQLQTPEDLARRVAALYSDLAAMHGVTTSWESLSPHDRDHLLAVCRRLLEV